MQKNSMEHVMAPATEYFGRLLLWASTSVAHPEAGIVAFKEGSYAELYGSMAAIKEQEIAAGISGLWAVTMPLSGCFEDV